MLERMVRMSQLRFRSAQWKTTRKFSRMNSISTMARHLIVLPKTVGLVLFSIRFMV